MIYAILISLLLAPFTEAASDHSLESRCIDITFSRDRPQWREKTPREVYQEIEQSNLDQDINALIAQGSIFETAWIRMFVPHKHERMMGFYEAILSVHEAYFLKGELGATKESWQQKAKDFFSEKGRERLKSLLPDSTNNGLGTPLSPSELKMKLTEPRDANWDESGLGGMVGKNPKLPSLLCLKFDPLNLKNCEEAFNYAFKKFYNSGNTDNLGNGWLVDLLSSDVAAKGAFHLVSKMLSRILTHNFSHASFITDAKQSFLEAGYSEKDAEKWSKDFIFASVVHGQLTYNGLSRFIQPFNHMTMIATFAASMFSATLDSLVLESEGHLYSVPEQIKSPCDNGKSYHFLVPWYIASKLKEKGYSEATSRAIPYAFEWGYQIFSNSYRRNPLVNASLPYDSVSNQSNRLDLMYSALGAIVGAKGKAKLTNVDFHQAFNESQDSVGYIYRFGVNKMFLKNMYEILLVNLGRYPPKKFINTLDKKLIP